MMYRNLRFPQMKLTLLACSIFCMMQTASAEEATTVDTVKRLDTIVVEATRTNRDVLNTPASIYRIKQTSDHNDMNVNLSETLKGIPGLQLNNRENYAQDLQISMRGFGARSTFGVRGLRLYVDGIPATMPDGQGQTSNIDLNSLDHIEVLGGAFSSLYGNSSGGTILTKTKEGQGKDSIQLSYSGGSHHKGQANVVLQGGAKNANEPSYVVSSSYFDTDGFRDHSAADKVLNNAKLTWDLEDGSKINWLTNYVKISADDAGGLNREQWKADPKQVASNVLKYNARKDIEQIQTGLTWNKPINDQHELYAMAYWGQRAVTQYQSIPSMSQSSVNHAGGVIDFDRDYFGADFRWTGNELIKNTKLIAGLTIDAMDEDRNGYQNFIGDELGIKGALRRDEKNTLWNLDPYVQASYHFLPDWTLDAGLRYSNVHFKSKDQFLTNGDNSGNTDYQRLLPSVALSWKIQPELLAYVNYAQGFETPTFTEMYYPASGHEAQKYDLKAAKSDTYEIGLKSESNLGLITLAAFETKTKDDIVSVASDGGRSTFRNADQTLRKGVEFSWNKDLWRDLAAQFSYSYIDAQFDADIPAISTTVSAVPAGNYIPGIAKNQAFLGLAWQPKQGLHAGVDVRYSDKIYVDDANSDQAPSYIISSAHLGYKWLKDDWLINTYARVDNIFDKEYVGSVIVNESNKRFFEPADGRNWNMGLSVTKQF